MAAIVMKRLGFVLVALSVAPALASEQDDRAAVAARFATLVHEGGRLDELNFAPAPLPEEQQAVAALAGCTPAVAAKSRADWIMLDWACAGRPEAERQTAVKFERNGTRSLWINPLERQMAPASEALAGAKLPGFRTITAAFARAVKAGDDPTLGGLIPISAESRARLAGLKGLDHVSTTGKTRGSQTMFWDVRGKALPAPIATDLRFDDEGRPIGLVLSATSQVK